MSLHTIPFSREDEERARHINIHIKCRNRQQFSSSPRRPSAINQINLPNDESGSNGSSSEGDRNNINEIPKFVVHAPKAPPLNKNGMKRPIANRASSRDLTSDSSKKPMFNAEDNRSPPTSHKKSEMKIDISSIEPKIINYWQGNENEENQDGSLRADDADDSGDIENNYDENRNRKICGNKEYHEESNSAREIEDDLHIMKKSRDVISSKNRQIDISLKMKESAENSLSENSGQKNMYNENNYNEEKSIDNIPIKSINRNTQDQPILENQDKDLHEGQIALISPITSTTSVETNVRTYRFERTINRSLRGKRYHFQLSFCGIPIFHTKLKVVKNVEKIYISEGNQMHFKDEEFVAVILVGNSNSSYSLRRDGLFGREMMSIRYFQKPLEKRKIMSINFFGNKNIRFVLTSRKPKSLAGKSGLDFGSRYNVPSKKNMILEDQNGNEMIAVMKTASGSLNIDAIDTIESTCVFAIGIAASLKEE